MADHILTMEKAKLFVTYPEIYKIFWKEWEMITEVNYDALEYLVTNSSYINLPNVKELSSDKMVLLKDYKGYLNIGVIELNSKLLR